MSITIDLAALFRRDLAKFSKQIETFPTDEALGKHFPV